MKELVARLKLYTNVLVKKFIYAWQIETAYAGNTIGELFSTISYNMTFLLFMDIVLKKFKLLAGYNFQDMLVLIFVSQVIFYTGLTFTYTSVEQFVKSVRDGAFDMLLLKPISVLFQVMTLGVRPFSGFFLSIPSLMIYIILIVQQHAFHPTTFALITGIIGVLLGMLLMHFYRFAFAMIVFKTKQVKNLLKTLDFLGDAGSFPYEAYEGVVKFLVLFLSPFLAAAGIPSMYFLNKTQSLIPLGIEAGIVFIFILTTLLLWKSGLKKYESASS